MKLLSLYSPFMDDVVNCEWFVSDRENKNVDTRYGDEIIDEIIYDVHCNCIVNKGIHVVTNYFVADVISKSFKNPAIIKVKCFRKDFVAAGVLGDNPVGIDSRAEELVFMKIFIPIEEYANALNNYLCEEILSKI